MAEIDYDVVRHIGVLAEKPNGWRKEANIVSWNHAEPKLDIRDWSPDHEKMGRGLTFTQEEVRNLYAVLDRFMGKE